MGKVGNVILSILGIFLLLGAFSGDILDGIKGWRTEDTTESFAITTGAGETTENVTLASDLFQDDVGEVIAITSNITGESPVATTYTASTNVLLISALNPSANHTIAVNYYADTDSDVMIAVGPFLGFLIIGFLAFILIKSAWKR